MDNALHDIESRPAQQQPQWDAPSALQQARRELAARPALVTAEQTRTLRSALARVAVGEAHVVQAGDCAEDPAECTAGDLARKAGLLNILAGTIQMITHKPVLRVGRIAGQFAKPRSQATEQVGDRILPVYRGHLVNGPEPDPASRRPDPRRLVSAYQAASAAIRHLGWHDPAGRAVVDPPIWTSHEALLLDYELPQIRRDEQGRLYLASTHWPWLGERTRQLDSAHVALLSRVTNPVACKIGPKATRDEVLGLCESLDPEREPGRLTLIARMGTDQAADRIRPLVTAVRAAGHPVVWLTDPMHGNTVTAPNGLKTRLLDRIVREVRAFQNAVNEAGGVAGGLHLETTPDDVTECVPDAATVDQVGDKCTSLCDPRLNPQQALAVVAAWSG